MNLYDSIVIWFSIVKFQFCVYFFYFLLVYFLSVECTNVIGYFLYIIICVILFFIIFMRNEMFSFFFTPKFNNITDYNHPEFTGGVTYELKSLKQIFGM